MINLQHSKEKHLLGSDRDENKEANIAEMRTYYQGMKIPLNNKDLDLIRTEIRAFLESNKSTPTYKFIERISNAYENHISMQD